jgi:hypothetical protein
MAIYYLRFLRGETEMGILNYLQNAVLLVFLLGFASIAIIFIGQSFLISLYSHAISRARKYDINHVDAERQDRNRRNSQLYFAALLKFDAASKYSTLLVAVGGMAGLILLLLNIGKILDWVGSVTIGKQSFIEIITVAHAEAAYTPQLGPLIPFVAVGVLMLMGVAFIGALATLLWLPDTKENQARIKAADNIVKTFGGFFTGLATTLLK